MPESLPRATIRFIQLHFQFYSNSSLDELRKHVRLSLRATFRRYRNNQWEFLSGSFQHRPDPFENRFGNHDEGDCFVGMDFPENLLGIFPIFDRIAILDSSNFEVSRGGPVC